MLRRLLAEAELDRVLVLEQEIRGAHAANMHGVEASVGEVVAILNSDDFFHPRRIERLLAELSAGGHQLSSRRDKG